MSRFKCVFWHKGQKKWVARITVSLGIYEREEDAARAADVALRTLHGEFAALNLPIPEALRRYAAA